MKELRIAILGHRFMGRAHSNAWHQVSRFFDVPFKPVLQVACGSQRDDVATFAERWGWAEIETDWRKVVEREDVDVVDICLPTYLHAEPLIAAVEAGKHVFCEKPVSLSLAEAEAMRDAAKKAGVVHFLNHNYRRCPAVALAKQIIEEGRLGEIYHWRGAYQQSWLVDPEYPLDWKLKRSAAGAGPLWDLGSHAVDLMQYLVGDLASLTCLGKQFIPTRPLMGDASQQGAVEVECAALIQGELENGGLASIETTRYATGTKNRHVFEVYGSDGAMTWDMENMNQLRFHSSSDPAHLSGFRDVLVTEEVHPYVGNWWPSGHIIGYEHSFVHGVADFLNAIGGSGEVRPNLEDGVRIMRVLEAAARSMASGNREILRTQS